MNVRLGGGVGMEQACPQSFVLGLCSGHLCIARWQFRESYCEYTPWFGFILMQLFINCPPPLCTPPHPYTQQFSQGHTVDMLKYHLVREKGYTYADIVHAAHAPPSPSSHAQSPNTHFVSLRPLHWVAKS